MNPPRERDPIFGNSAGSTRYIGLGSGTLPDNSGPATYGTFDFPNVDIKPEKGEYFTVGFLLNAGNFMANVDYYDIEISEYTRTMTVANVVDTLAAEIPGGRHARKLGADELRQRFAHAGHLAALGGRPLVELASPCVPGQTTMLGLVGGRVNYFAGNGQTNSGELKTRGIDVTMSYRFDIGPLSITPSVDYSRIFEWELGDFIINGVKVADGYDGLGFVNGVHRPHQPVGREVPRERRTRLRDRPPHAEHSEPVRAGDHQRGSDAVHGHQQPQREHRRRQRRLAERRSVHGLRPAHVRTSATCRPARAPGSSRRTRRSSRQPRGFCAAQNTATLAGQKVDELLNVDLIYRVRLPAEIAATLDGGQRVRQGSVVLSRHDSVQHCVRQPARPHVQVRRDEALLGACSARSLESANARKEPISAGHEPECCYAPALRSR